jgi:hypothetical protein
MADLHRLKTGWTLYYHDPNTTSYVIESYIPLITFHTVEELGALSSLLQEKHVLNGMFFLMREGIEPVWESKDNRDGGAWSIKVYAEKVYRLFMDIIFMTVGETLCRDDVEINGITISPKPKFCLIKIWNRDSKVTDTTVINTPAFIAKESIQYKPHKEGKGFDTPSTAGSADTPRSFSSTTPASSPASSGSHHRSHYFTSDSDHSYRNNSGSWKYQQHTPKRK